MALQQGSSEDVAEVRYHFGAEKGTWVVTDLDTYGNITQVKEYSSTTLLNQEDIYYSSFKALISTEATGNWAETGDGAVSIVASAWIDGSTSVLRNTYTFSTGSSVVKDVTTYVAGVDLADWIGECVTGYITVWLRFSDFVNVTSTTLKIGSTADGTSNYRSVVINSGAEYNSYTANNVWFPLVFDLSTGTSTGTPDGDSVKHLSLTFAIAAGVAQTIDISCFYAAVESATVVAGEDLFAIGRITNAWQSEGVTYESKYVYDADENLYGIVRSGGY